jgi:hypothetical protein
VTPDVHAQQPFFESLWEHLEIPAHLANCIEKSLCISYAKYIAYIEALTTLDRKWNNKELPFDQKPTCKNVIETMQSKIFWYDYICKFFPHVADYPKMVAWLENREDGPSDIEVWGIEKEKYLFGDLEKYLANGGVGILEEIKGVSEKKDKGKKKAVDKSQGGGSTFHKHKAGGGSGQSKGKGKETGKK